MTDLYATAARALEACVNKAPDAEQRAAHFRRELERQTGLSFNMLSLLRSYEVLP